MIVLEGGMDLKITADKRSLILRSLGAAASILLLTALSIAFTVAYFFKAEFSSAMAYAIPLSVVSSAMVIPSVARMPNEKREFLVYECTFSDILGIMFFNFFVGAEGPTSSVALYVFLNLAFTLVIAVVACYSLLYLTAKIRTQIRIFLILSLLFLVYGLGKKLHISSLVIVFAFGLILNNIDVFLWGRLKKYIPSDGIEPAFHDFHLLTAETAFLARTFFFVVFGMSIDLATLADPKVVAIGGLLLVILYSVRFVNLKFFLRAGVMPELLLSPRGLITILLYYSIPPAPKIRNFGDSTMLFVIFVSAVMMMIGTLLPAGNEGRSLELGIAPADDDVAQR
jgi:NhaP-type Na+/H+ or K+/H+ antiporter